MSTGDAGEAHGIRKAGRWGVQKEVVQDREQRRKRD